MENFELVDLVFDDGTSVAVSAVVVDPEQEVALERLTVRTKDLIDAATHLVRDVKDKMVEFAPDELSLTVKMGVAIESGIAVAIFANGKVDGAIELCLTWRT